MEYAIRFATGDFPFSKEAQCLGMAIQGAVMIRNGPNREKKLHWFHAFVYSMLAGFAGGWLGFIWMGKTSAMLASDINFGTCIIAFALVNWVPYDLGFHFCNLLPVTILYTSFAQLFRSSGIMGFVNTCHAAVEPTIYYPSMPVFGPILYATLLGNMGGIVMKGLEGHVQNGVPWPAQNGFFCATFYHFFVHDLKGPIGRVLRAYTPLQGLLNIEDDNAYAAFMIVAFMQVMGILQLPRFIGPQFTPFGADILNPWKDSSSWEVGKQDSAYSKKKRNRGRRKKKVA